MDTTQLFFNIKIIFHPPLLLLVYTNGLFGRALCPINENKSRKRRRTAAFNHWRIAKQIRSERTEEKASVQKSVNTSHNIIQQCNGGPLPERTERKFGFEHVSIYRTSYRHKW